MRLCRCTSAVRLSLTGELMFVFEAVSHVARGPRRSLDRKLVGKAQPYSTGAAAKPQWVCEKGTCFSVDENQINHYCQGY